METSRAQGAVMIVDDDPVVTGLLDAALTGAGYAVVESHSGEAALALLATLDRATLPDILFLDIEMGCGIDGYEVCRQLKAGEATRQMPVVFLSSHDSLDDRLRAYDAGGGDFMAKPSLPAELLRKAGLAIAHKRREETLAAEGRSSAELAAAALVSLDDSGITLKFSRGALGAGTLEELAQLTIAAMGAFGIACHVQLRSPGQTLTLTPRGQASPLEASVIEMSQRIDRIFSFGNRLIINYDSVSLLVPNMPVADTDLCGRIRDQAAIMAEIGELAMANIQLRADAQARTGELRQLANVSSKTIGVYRELQVKTRVEFESMANAIESMYNHLGLTNKQEYTISDTVRGAIARVLELYESSSELDQNFTDIIAGLTRAGEYELAEMEETRANIELF